MDEYSLPAAYMLPLVELVKRWHVSPDDLLSDFGLETQALTDPQRRLSTPTVVGLVERARALTGEPALGFFLGLQMRISVHGYLGFAVMASGTMREGIELAIRFIPIVTTALGLRLRVEGSEASLIVEEHTDFGNAREVVLLSLLIGLWQIGRTMTRRDLDGFADLALPPPPHHERLKQIAPRVRFGRPTNRLVFDAAMLDLPYTMSDPAAQQLARDQCERILSSLGLDGRLVPRVRGLIANTKGGVPSLERVASEVHLSPRTLKRQLATEGVSFSSLVEEELRERAVLMLAAQEVSVKDIAARLGYSNVANFARAFQRWTGSTPAEHRNANGAPRRR
jgi:AraC-like DNA-binding protein